MNKGTNKFGIFYSGYLDQYIKSKYRILFFIIPILYFLILLIISLSARKIGNYGVETDFFWSYIPQAKAFLDGNLIIDGFRGPVYPIVLGIVTLLVKDFFISGMLISIISGSIVLFFTAKIINILSSGKVSLLVIVFLAINPFFIQYTYTCGTDMFFNALVSGAIYYYLKQNKYSYYFLVVNGILAGIIYLTRSNGIFMLVIGLFILFDIKKATLRIKVSYLLTFIVSFLVVILPWNFYCYYVKGSFFYDKNYLNVAFEFYNKGTLNREEFWFGENHFNSIFSVIAYKPLVFVSSFLNNIYEHFGKDLNQLVGLQIGLFSILGLLLKLKTKIVRTEAKFFVFILIFFLLLSLTFYSERFSLFLIPFYLYLALNLFYDNEYSLSNYWPKDVLAIFVIILFGWTLINSISYNKIEIDYGPKEVLKIEDKFEYYIHEDVTHKILASRKPYLAYQLGLDFQVIPYETTVSGLLNSLKRKR